jgi:hypothetical protein
MRKKSKHTRSRERVEKMFLSFVEELGWGSDYWTEEEGRKIESKARELLTKYKSAVLEEFIFN